MGWCGIFPLTYSEGRAKGGRLPWDCRSLCHKSQLSQQWTATTFKDSLWSCEASHIVKGWKAPKATGQYCSHVLFRRACGMKPGFVGQWDWFLCDHSARNCHPSDCRKLTFSQLHRSRPDSVIMWGAGKLTLPYKLKQFAALFSALTGGWDQRCDNCWGKVNDWHMGRFAKMDPMDVPEVLAGTGVEISIGKENADGSKMKFEVQRFFDKLCPSELGRNPRQKHPKMSKDIHGINSPFHWPFQVMGMPDTPIGPRGTFEDVWCSATTIYRRVQPWCRTLSQQAWKGLLRRCEDYHLIDSSEKLKAS